METKVGTIVLVNTYKSNNVLGYKNCVWRQNHSGKLYYFDVLTSDSDMKLYTPYDLAIVSTNTLKEAVRGKEIYFNTYDKQFWSYVPAPCSLPNWGNIDTLKEVFATTDESLNLPISIDFVKKVCELYNKGLSFEEIWIEIDIAQNITAKFPKMNWDKNELSNIITKLMHQIHQGQLTFGDKMIDLNISPAEWIKQNVSFY